MVLTAAVTLLIPVPFRLLDDKVSTVKKEKIQALAGGGEDSVAYILLYRAVVL
jgi:ubiquitin carboxyl-terminal hydrolase 14